MSFSRLLLTCFALWDIYAIWSYLICYHFSPHNWMAFVRPNKRHVMLCFVILLACGESRQSLHLHPSRPYCRHKETWKTTKTLDGRHQRLDRTTSGWVWELHRTEQHGVQRCRRLWPSTLRNEEEPVQSSLGQAQYRTFIVRHMTSQTSWIPIFIQYPFNAYQLIV